MIRIDRLTSGYSRMEALHGVSLSIAPGQTVAVLGANGAGKTTLCRVVSGLVPAWSGTIEVDGVDVTKASNVERVRRGIIQVPEGRQVFPEMTIEENLKLGAYIHDRVRPEDLDLVCTLFPILKTRLTQNAGLLSGGEQQMLALARALMSRPKYLLLDEPSQGIAPKVIEQMGDAIRSIAATGVAILLVEQNLFLAEAICEHAFIMENGTIMADGPTAQILKSNLVQDSYLGA